MTALDQSKADAFAGQMLGVLNNAALALMISLGHRTGLLDAMGRLTKPATSREIADEAKLSERYVREWLGTMVTSGWWNTTRKRGNISSRRNTRPCSRARRPTTWPSARSSSPFSATKTNSSRHS